MYEPEPLRRIRGLACGKQNEWSSRPHRLAWPKGDVHPGYAGPWPLYLRCCHPWSRRINAPGCSRAGCHRSGKRTALSGEGHFQVQRRQHAPLWSCPPKRRTRTHLGCVLVAKASRHLGRRTGLRRPRKGAGPCPLLQLIGQVVHALGRGRRHERGLARADRDQFLGGAVDDLLFEVGGLHVVEG